MFRHEIKTFILAIKLTTITTIYVLFNKYFCGPHSHRMSLCTNINTRFLPTYVIIVFGVLWFWNHNILSLTSHPNPIVILPRKKINNTSINSFFQEFIYIYKTDMQCLGYKKFVRFFSQRNQHFLHFTIAKEWQTNSD